VNSQLWCHANDYVTFWDLAYTHAPDLARLAMRLHETPANSVPSERSFSAMNYIQNDYRTRLSTAKTNKLTYIYMNTKALRRRPLLESHHNERRRRRQEREKLITDRKRRRQQDLEILRAQGVSFGIAGVAVKTEQLPDDDLNELFEQAVASIPDYDASIQHVQTAPVAVASLSGFIQTQQPQYHHTSFDGSYIDPVFIST
jgi:hypothetical protein